MMIWPSRHFERFHDWAALRLRRADGYCICGLVADPGVVDDFDESSWCSLACFNDVALRCGLIKPALFVFERDRGTCASCGADADLAERAVRRLRAAARWDFRLGYSENMERTEPARSAVRLILDTWRVSEETRSLWDADHVVPVIEGGGGCGLDNYRTLCVTCHRGETSSLATRRAERRRSQKSLLRTADF